MYDRRRIEIFITYTRMLLFELLTTVICILVIRASDVEGEKFQTKIINVTKQRTVFIQFYYCCNFVIRFETSVM